jgi:hypothetical protein
VRAYWGRLEGRGDFLRAQHRRYVQQRMSALVCQITGPKKHEVESTVVLRSRGGVGVERGLIVLLHNFTRISFLLIHFHFPVSCLFTFNVICDSSRLHHNALHLRLSPTNHRHSKVTQKPALTHFSIPRLSQPLPTHIHRAHPSSRANSTPAPFP